MTNYRYTYSAEAIAYSTFRAEWRAEYKQLSQNIRELKAEARRLWAADKPLRAAAACGEREALSCTAFNMMVALDEKKAAWKELLASGHVARTLNEQAMIAAE